VKISGKWNVRISECSANHFEGFPKGPARGAVPRAAEGLKQMPLRTRMVCRSGEERGQRNSKTEKTGDWKYVPENLIGGPWNNCVLGLGNSMRRLRCC
jgi:hypothetical protein